MYFRINFFPTSKGTQFRKSSLSNFSFLSYHSDLGQQHPHFMEQLHINKETVYNKNKQILWMDSLLGNIADIFHTKLEHWCMFIFNLEGWKESGTSTCIWQKDRKRFQGTEHSRETTKSKKITQNTIRERTWERNAKRNLSKVSKDEKINCHYIAIVSDWDI